MTETRGGLCPVCDRALRLPAGSAGRKVACRGCASVLRIEDGDGSDFVLTPCSEPGPPAGPEAPADCPACHRPVLAGDAFCNHCGHDLAQPLAAPAAAPAPESRRRARSRARRQVKMRQVHERKVATAAKVLALIAIVFLVIGTISGFEQRAQAQKAHAALSRLEPDDVIDVAGKELSVTEARRTVDFEVVLVFGLNYLLGAIMLALFFWALRSPFPAILTGLCVYLVLIVVNAVVDPTTIVRGMIVKIVIISVLLGGMTAALKQRASRGRRSSTHRAAALAPAR